MHQNLLAFEHTFLHPKYNVAHTNAWYKAREEKLKIKEKRRSSKIYKDRTYPRQKCVWWCAKKLETKVRMNKKTGSHEMEECSIAITFSGSLLVIKSLLLFFFSLSCCLFFSFLLHLLPLVFRQTLP